MNEMNLQEAIRMIHPDTSRDEIWKHPYCGYQDKMIKVIDEAITIVCDAAKKQIEVAPIVYTDTRQQVYTDVQVDTYECPMCGSYLCDCDDADEYGPLYCPDCGQKIDWSVLNE